MHNLKAGTFGGTVLSIVPSLQFHDVGRTVILGIVGAVVSFFMSMFLKWIVEHAKTKFK